VANAPDFFIVGAARCGTTFMHRTLARHPDVFVPEEQHPYHCADLDPGDRGDPNIWIRNPAEYKAQFETAAPGALVGEVCPWYLYSKVAASRIAALNPRARVIIQLRHPVDQLAARHALRVRDGTEDLSLAKALEAEADRMRGHRLPSRTREPARYMYAYRGCAGFAEQVKRYLNVFPREQIHFLLLEDLRRDPTPTLHSILAFLRLSKDFRPDLDPIDPTGNVGKTAQLLAQATRVAPGFLQGPTRSLAGRAIAATWNPNSKPTIPSALRRKLDKEFLAEIKALSELIQRDLSSIWTN
jgi:hypothetical protein